MINASNVIMLTGNLGKAPETKTFESGSSVTEFSLATNDTYKDKEGNRQTRTEWHNVKAFGKTGEIIAQYVGQGDKLQVIGTMRYRKWQDKDGNNRRQAEVIVESFNFLPSGNKEARVSDPVTINGGAQQQTQPVPRASRDLPF